MMRTTVAVLALLSILLQLVDGRLFGGSKDDPKPKPSTRVVGGKVVEDSDESPFFVNLGGCSGSLIHGDIVLTAAHVRSMQQDNQVAGSFFGTISPFPSHILATQ